MKTIQSSHLIMLGLATLALSVWAQSEKPMSGMKMSDKMDHSKMGHSMPQGTKKPAGNSAYMKEMHQGMTKMNQDMMKAPMTGNPDHDFAAMMIPHHAGAIAMAKTELKYGKDPVLRQLARQIIADQNKEIALMKRRLATLKTTKAR